MYFVDGRREIFFSFSSKGISKIIFLPRDIVTHLFGLFWSWNMILMCCFFLCRSVKTFTHETLNNIARLINGFSALLLLMLPGKTSILEKRHEWELKPTFCGPRLPRWMEKLVNFIIYPLSGVYVSFMQIAMYNFLFFC